MTTEQLKHLRLLKAHLENLLAGAKERTPGEWHVEQTDTTNWVGTLRRDGRKIDELVCDTDREDLKFYALQRNDNNATFIASCAGNAEAGWRYALRNLNTWKRLYDGFHTSEFKQLAASNLQALLDEWPIESLKL